MKYANIRVSQKLDCLEKLVGILEKLGICKIKEQILLDDIIITLEYGINSQLTGLLNKFSQFYNVEVLGETI